MKEERISSELSGKNISSIKYMMINNICHQNGNSQSEAMIDMAE